MGLTQEIQKRIDKKEEEIAELEGQIRLLERQRDAARAYIQGLKDILPKAQRDEEPTGIREMELRPGSAPYFVREFLRKHGKAFHINEILEGIGKPNDKSNRLSLAGTLGRYDRLKTIFKRVGPNTFALIESESDQLPKTEDLLPNDFGK